MRNSTGSMKKKVWRRKNEKPGQEDQDFRNPPKSWDFADRQVGEVEKEVDVGSQPNFYPSIASEKRGSFPPLSYVHLSPLTHRSLGGFSPPIYIPTAPTFLGMIFSCPNQVYGVSGRSAHNFALYNKAVKIAPSLTLVVQTFFAPLARKIFFFFIFFFENRYGGWTCTGE